MASDPLRVALVIDDLGAGGAQRQLTVLAAGLRRRGHEVVAFTYRRGDFFAGALAEAGVPVVRVSSRNRPQLAFAMRAAIRRNDPDAVLAFLPGPSALAELAALPRRRFAVVASERVLDLSGRSPRRVLRHVLHRLADAVVSNSHAQRVRMLKLAPALAARTSVIVNGIDTERFAPGDPPDGSAPGRLRLLVPARIRPLKNPFGLLEAVDILRRERPDLDITVDWHGDAMTGESARNARRAAWRRALEEEIARRSLGERFRLRAPAEDVVPLYRAADALCLPSFSEGVSNAIGEAMACGLPVLASRVSDTPRLVEDGRTGFLFDPHSPADMADAIARLAAMPPAERRAMGLAGRAAVEAGYSLDACIDAWDGLIRRLVRARSRSPRRRECAAPSR